MEHEFKPFDKVLWREESHRVWQAGFYERECDDKRHYIIGKEYPMLCVPYEGNEKLLGETDNPVAKYEFKFGDKVTARSTGNLSSVKHGIFHKKDSISLWLFVSDCDDAARFFLHNWNFKAGWDEEEE